MGADDRNVRHLRLRASDASGVHRGTRLIEDALRCASFAQSSHRLVMVRRLALGVLPDRLNTQTLALRIEHAWRQRSGAAVHGGERAAGSAATAWFRDALDAHLCLGLRLAEGAAPREWYWPLAVAGYDPGRAPRAALRSVLLSLAGREAAGVAVPAWVAGMAAAGRVHAVAAAIEAGDVRELRERAGLAWSGAAAAAQAAADRADDALQPVATGEAGVAAPAMHGKRSDAAATPGDRPAHATGDAGSTECVWAFLNDALEAAGAPRASTGSALAAINVAGRRKGPFEAPPLSRRAAEPNEAADSPAARVDAPTASSSTAAAHAGVAQTPVEEPAHLMPFEAPLTTIEATFRPTQAAGLLFLVPVLARLGYAEWAAEHLPPRRQAAVARKLWFMLLQRLDVPAEDPAWHLAADTTDPPKWLAGADGALVAIGAGSQRAPPAESPASPQERPQADDLARSAGAPRTGARDGADALGRCATAWLRRCRRWLRLRAGIGPASLVLRPGAIDLSPTHADLLFDLRDADIRVRRAGLDLDPGWVPWLGRVVAIHYERGAQGG